MGNILVKVKKKPRSMRYLAIMKRVLCFWLFIVSADFSGYLKKK